MLPTPGALKPLVPMSSVQHLELAGPTEFGHTSSVLQATDAPLTGQELGPADCQHGRPGLSHPGTRAWDNRNLSTQFEVRSL